MAQQVVLKVSGLYSFPNRISSIPNGALLRASNIVINRDNVAESRRGFKLYGTSSGGSASITSHQLLDYKGRLIRHFGIGSGTTLEVDSDGAGTFTPFNTSMSGTLASGSATVSGITTTSTLAVGMSVSGTGIPASTTISSITDNNHIVLSANATVNGANTLTFTWTISEAASGLRIRGIEQNGNFYFTSSNGIQKISALGTSDLPTAVINPAGGIKALDLNVALNSQEGFFTQESVIAYRLVWGIKDANNNLILGSPSGRVVLTNPVTPLLIRDFNALLALLDTCNVTSGINDQTYVSLLKVKANSDPTILRTGLIALAAKLDSDIIITGGNATVKAKVVSNVASVVFTSSVANTLSVNDNIIISGFTGVGNTLDLNGGGSTISVRQISSITTTTVANDTITFSITHADFAFTNDVNGVVKRWKYTNTAYTTNSTIFPQPVTLDAVPKTNQLVGTGNTTDGQGLQTYFNQIVDSLKSEKSGIVSSPKIFYAANSTQSSTVNLNFAIPHGVTTAHFYQVYRTGLTLAASATALTDDGSGNPYDPGDEQKLCYEANPTSSDLDSGSITIQDVTPDSFLGAYLYTNPNSGEGISQSNDAPPWARDITAFKGYTFYANTKTRQTLNLSMLSVTKLQSGTSSITITDNTTTNTYTFVIGLAKTQTITTVADVAGSLNSTYFKISSGANAVSYYYYFTNGTGVDPAPTGYTLGSSISFTNNATAATIATAISAALNKNSDFFSQTSGSIVTVTNTSAGISTTASNGTASPGFAYAIVVDGQGEDATNKKIIFTPAMGSEDNITIISVANPTVVTSVGHGLTTGQIVQISGSNSTPVIDGNFAVTVTGADTFTIPVNVTVAGTIGTWQVSPVYTPSQQITETSQSLIRVVNKNSAGIVYFYYLSGPTDIPGQMYVEARSLSQVQFHIIANSATTTGVEFQPQLPASGSAVASSNSTQPNRIYYSKYQQPEAVPLLNYVDIGPQDKNILRALALRDNLFILKEEGIYRLSGLTTPFTVTPFDYSTVIKAADSAVVLNNLIYMSTNQGVATVSDTGVAIISRPIEDLLLSIQSFTNYSKATFGVSYESDRAYYLFTLTASGDTYATQCFRFNTFTNTWTLLTLGKRSGLVLSSDDKLYLGPTDTNYLEQERKSFDRTDYADREISMVLAPGSVTGISIVLPNLNNVTEGDVLTQTQYVTVSKYNRLLSKLDNDASLSPKTYVSSLTAVAGDDLSVKLDNVITKIANDTGRLAMPAATLAATYLALTPTASDFVSQQTNFNNLINLLNNDAGTGSHNYATISGTVTYEFNLLSIDHPNLTVIAPYTYPLIPGPITIYNHISTDIQFVPQVLTDTSITKQVSEGTFIFEDSSFTSASIQYSTDLSASFEGDEIEGNGSGVFGSSPYGDGIFGGNGSGIPFRTLVPREKQRCRYINCRFKHTIAREIFSLYGISLTYNPISQRGWR